MLKWEMHPTIDQRSPIRFVHCMAGVEVLISFEAWAKLAQ